MAWADTIMIGTITFITLFTNCSIKINVLLIPLLRTLNARHFGSSNPHLHKQDRQEWIMNMLEALPEMRAAIKDAMFKSMLSHGAFVIQQSLTLAFFGGEKVSSAT